MFFYCSCEFVPVSFFEVGVGGFGCADVRCGQGEGGDDWEVIGRHLLDCSPGDSCG